MRKKNNMSEINDIDFEEDQQDIIEKTDIKTLSHYCLMLQKSNSEKINMQLTIDKLTAEVNALKKEKEEEKENWKVEIDKSEK